MPLLPYDYLQLMNCPEVVTISDILCSDSSYVPGASLQYLAFKSRVLNLPPGRWRWRRHGDRERQPTPEQNHVENPE